MNHRRSLNGDECGRYATPTSVGLFFQRFVSGEKHNWNKTLTFCRRSAEMKQILFYFCLFRLRGGQLYFHATIIGHTNSR